MEGDGAEGLAQEGRIDHQELEHDGDADGTQELDVAEQVHEGLLPR